MPSLTGTCNQRSVFRRSRSRRSIWRPESINVVTFPPLLCRWMASSAWRRRIHLNTYPAVLRRKGSNPTSGCADTARVGWVSYCSEKPTSASRAPGIQNKISVYRDCSGRMGPYYTYSAKERTGKHNLRFVFYTL